MPNPGTVNNPSGANSFDHFAPEPAYGEGTSDAALAGGAPLAGGKVAAGAITAPKRSQRQAGKSDTTPRPDFAPAPEQTLTTTPPVASDPSAVWAEIASTPGAEHFPILSYYAQGH